MHLSDDLAARFAAGLGDVAERARDRQILGLAVSGGGDSLAMLHLAAGAGLQVRVVTVDHGLRPEAAAEAALVGRICAGLGMGHDILRWHWDGKGNLQDAARRARRGLIGAWAVGLGLGTVALAHTRDDVAETFMMRLARGAGVDGLAAMVPGWTEAGVGWVRPLLGASRAELRHHLRGLGRTWVEDPSNSNDRFDRVKARKALALLQPLGISVERLAAVADHLADARQALEAVTGTAWTRVMRDHGLAVHIDMPVLASEPVEVQRRLVVALIRRLAAGDYAPRGGAVRALLARLLAGKGGVLAGCRFQVVRGQAWGFREAKAVAGLVAEPDQPWDGAWRIVGPALPETEVRALGAGIDLCRSWRAAGLPRAALVAGPALWQGGRLIAAPHAGFGPDYGVISLLPAAGRHHLVISH